MFQKVCLTDCVFRSAFLILADWFYLIWIRFFFFLKQIHFVSFVKFSKHSGLIQINLIICCWAWQFWPQQKTWLLNSHDSPLFLAKIVKPNKKRPNEFETTISEAILKLESRSDLKIHLVELYIYFGLNSLIIRSFPLVIKIDKYFFHKLLFQKNVACTIAYKWHGGAKLGDKNKSLSTNLPFHIFFSGVFLCLFLKRKKHHKKPMKIKITNRYS